MFNLVGNDKANISPIRFDSTGGLRVCGCVGVGVSCIWSLVWNNLLYVEFAEKAEKKKDDKDVKKSRKFKFQSVYTYSD